jgi:hypothetical protein
MNFVNMEIRMQKAVGAAWEKREFTKTILTVRQ